MSLTTTSCRPGPVSRSMVSDLAAICRARQLVATLGGRFSLELGIDVDYGRDEVERWALAATLLGSRTSTSTAMRTYRVLEHAGVRTIDDMRGRTAEEIVSLLDEGGYPRRDESTAAWLLALAEVIADRFGGRLATLGEEVADSDELERSLTALPGWSPVTARAFLRELRGVWPGADMALDQRAVAAAEHIQLPAGSRALMSCARFARLDLRDLEAGLIRLTLAHDLAGCPGAEECPFAAFDRDQLVRH